jgi:hypothetical protein
MNPLTNSFLDFSSELTSFTVFELYGTGQAASYLAAAEKVVGTPLLTELLNVWSGIAALPAAERAPALRRLILGDEKLGPVARNIVRLWYTGVWNELPTAWTEKYGAAGADVNFVVSPSAYTEGLLWTAIGANPHGAKAPGYASWAAPPTFPPF